MLKQTTANFIIIDEIGPLEMQNKGWSSAIENLLATNTPMIWIVRKSLLASVTNHWQIHQAQVFDISKYTTKKVVNAVKKQLDV